jgi:hypothetical protein
MILISRLAMFQVAYEPLIADWIPKLSAKVLERASRSSRFKGADNGI